MRNNREIYELTELLRANGNPTWRQVADEYNRTHTEQVTPNAVRKAYNRHLGSAGQSVKQIEKRKEMNLVRTLVETNAREYSEKSVIAQTIANVWGKEPHHERDHQRVVINQGKKETLYAFSDVHDGYKNDHPKMTYNPEITEKRIDAIFEWIAGDAKVNGYKRIYILDDGDPIEGAGLRVSQLMRIAEAMTAQAKHYTNLIASNIKWISQELNGVEIVYLMVSEDNHGQLRLYNTKRDELPENIVLLITNALKNIIDTAHEYGGMANIEFIAADEILLTLGEDKPFNIVAAHSHQYNRGDNILEQLSQRHDCTVHLFIGGHWHLFSVKYKNVKENGQQAMIWLPSVVGDTDFAERLFLSCYPGFCKITIDTENRVSNAELIRLS